MNASSFCQLQLISDEIVFFNNKNYWNLTKISSHVFMKQLFNILISIGFYLAYPLQHHVSNGALIDVREVSWIITVRAQCGSV